MIRPGLDDPARLSMTLLLLFAAGAYLGCGDGERSARNSQAETAPQTANRLDADRSEPTPMLPVSVETFAALRELIAKNEEQIQKGGGFYRYADNAGNVHHLNSANDPAGEYISDDVYLARPINWSALQFRIRESGVYLDKPSSKQSPTKFEDSTKDAANAVIGIEEFFRWISTATGTTAVKRGRAGGKFPKLESSEYLIQPGLGVGPVLIGASKADVWEKLGKPRDSDGSEDTWYSGKREFTVSYQGGVVVEISIGLSEFHTASGLRTGSSGSAFQRRFPDSLRSRCIAGIGAYDEEWFYLDAVSSGIAMLTDGNEKNGTLIVHRPGEDVNTQGTCFSLDSK